jgi:xanthine dehydrogenase YagT iron-sulfur-binding subunit
MPIAPIWYIDLTDSGRLPSLDTIVRRDAEHDWKASDASQRHHSTGSIARGAAAAIASAAGFSPMTGALAQHPPGALAVIRTTLRINGSEHPVSLDPRATLLDTLRFGLGLTGTKKGCDRGECGACTVHIDGRPALSCMTLAVMQAGHEITTIEGLARDGRLHAVQEAFIAEDAFQCGYCTPGQIMSALACIHEGHAGSDAEIAEYMSGNLCRCAAYPQIRAAIRAAAARGI